ncbi:alpha/beta hydrolase [Streptomyces sp. NBC_01142]|uniref:alpha/beta fold hydrolase n=1 Tax=Streptomyces sp. NBC_01142 TaxID=2975865 RepID=UPI0022552D2F|nr:alpha/beta hydrolase [Streptomyces sp. NBC_01142]MCX4824623.1 alpha/beta hydrolase [Streptomyces sp. NBC_01142]
MMHGLPCLSAGEGPPLIVLLFTPEAAVPTGASRRLTLRMLRPFSERFTTHLLIRPPGLPPTTTMTQLAAVHADAIRETFSGPVNVLGLSTGGSLALQLAADHPGLVDRLVLGGTACTLGPVGRRAQRRYIERARQGKRPSPALAEMLTGSTIGRTALKGLLWLMDGSREHLDAATMLGAEDGFDLRSRLHEIKAPTLLLQGGKDIVYPLDLARQTVQGIPDARLVVYQDRSHSGTFTDKRFSADALDFLRNDQP